MRHALLTAALLAALPVAGGAANPWELTKKVAGKSATGSLEKEINKRLLEEGRKNQCSFKSGTAELDAGCAPKAIVTTKHSVCMVYLLLVSR